MKPSELRIGNIVSPFISTFKGKLNSIRIISCLHRNIVEFEHLNTHEYSKIEPVKLDQTWFLAFGFINNSTDLTGTEWIGGNKKHGDLRLFLDNDKIAFVKYYPKNLDDGYWIPVDIKYVHELQNFYFTISKTELKFHNKLINDLVE
jgi:hypothetical protein